ncbi:hypothetical protein EP331_13945 [bacterium]|nr:MAG: hypothetical protein EP331_13945 [bacterium]
MKGLRVSSIVYVAKLVAASLCLLLLTDIAMAQNYEQMRLKLRQEQNKARAEIEELKKQLDSYESQLSESAQQFEEMTRELVKLEKEVALRMQVIQKLTEESNSIEKEINLTQAEYERQVEELNALIANYKKALIYLYKHGRTGELALILAAESVSQMLSRSFYLKKFAEHRKNQANEIKSKQEALSEKKAELEQSRAKNKQVLAEQKTERNKLDTKRKKQDQLVLAIQRNRTKLKTLLVSTKKELDSMNSTLDKLIADEIKVRVAEEKRLRELEAERLRRLEEARKIADANKRKEEIAKYEKPIVNTSGATLSEAEVKNLEDSFAKAKGKLPWPVESGVISAKYGNIVHPVYRTKIMNHGVEIATEPKANVYAIHDGVVFGVVPIKGYGDVVIVNHGKFNTVYGNLTEVTVRKDMFVRAGDLVGKGGDNYSPKGSAVFLMIRQDKENLNPELWIVKK